ncbi:hypothetical protein JCM3775_003043 [Rhodotorula graminis]
MLRRLSEASSLFSRGPPTSTDPPPPLPSSDSSHSLSSAALTEALSYDLVTSPQPTRVAHAQDDLRHALDDLQQASPSDVQSRLSALATIQLVLQEHDVQDVQGAFSTLGGFEIAVGALAAIDGAPRAARARSEEGGDVRESTLASSREFNDDDDVRFHLATLILHVLHLALRLPANADSLSYSALASALDLSGLLAPSALIDEKARSLSLLWAFLVGDFSEGASAVLVVRSQVVERLDRRRDEGDHVPSTALRAAREIVAARRAQGVVEAAVHPAAAALLLDLVDSHLDPTVDPELQLRATALALVTSLLDRRDGEKGAVGLGEAGLLRAALGRVLGPWEGDDGGRARVEGEEREIWVEMTRALLGSVGAATEAARRLFDAAGGRSGLDDELVQLILDALPGSRAPPCIEFDFGHTASSDLSLRSLGRAFPPSTHGYTLVAWISIDAPPTSAPLIIFGATDPSSRTFFELSLLPSMRLAVQTSLRTPPVEFAAFTLPADTFHHVALVHQRPKFVAQSMCSLYVDGELVDSVKVAYPASPPHEWDVQAWFGTPGERAAAPTRSRQDARATAPRWRLGPSWLVHGELQGDFLEVCSRLGPRYAGTFQDILGRFLTNSSASALNIRLDALSRDSIPTRGSSVIASSPLMYALRHRGSAVVPEHRIYFALSARNLLTSPASASETVKLAAAAKGTAIVNAAIPSQVDEVVVRLNGLALVENAAVVRRGALDDALWAAGGTTLLLRWIEKASTAKQLEMSVGVLVEALEDSWRLCEEAEERHAYEILALHLRAKASLVTAVVHDSILGLVGFDRDSPARSVVTNTLAFQHLVLDFQLWREVDPSVQRAHFDQLRRLITTSDLSEYNLKKLTKFHVVRKIVSAVRSKAFEGAVADEVVDFLMLVVRSAFTTDVVRYLATYLGAALTTNARTASRPASTSIDSDSHFVLIVGDSDAGPHREPLLMLRHLHDVLLDPTRAAALSKWAKHIRTKWALALLQDRSTPPLAAVLVLRILVRLLQTQGHPYVAKFANSDSGFALLRAALPRFWALGQVHLALFALLHGHDITTIPLDAPFAASTLLSSSGKAIAAAPEVIRIVIAVVGQGLSVLDRAQDEPATSQSDDAAGAGQDASRAGLERGFGVLVELLAQAGRTTAEEADWPLLSSPVALNDLIRVLQPVIRLPPAPEGLPDAELPPLPILAAAKGFELEQADDDKGDQASAPAQASPHVALSIDKTLSTDRGVDDSPPPALTASSQSGTTCSAATLVLDILAQQVTHGITTRHVRQTSSITPSLAQFASSDPSLQPLRILLDAGASSDVRSQVAFRNSLFKTVLHRLSRASTAPTVAGRVSSLVDVATSFTAQGWIADIPFVLGFVLAYLEKLLDETALVASPVQAGLTDIFFSCAGRLVLLGLLDPASVTATLKLLALHQLVVFSPQNEDVTKIRLILHRLARLVRIPEHADSAMHAIRLFALQRPTDVDAVCCRNDQDGSSDVSVVTQIVEADDTNLYDLVKMHDEQLERADSSWYDFLVEESAQGREAVVAELERMRDLAGQLEQKRLGQRRRLRKRRRSVSDWKGSVQEQDRARAAHVKQDRVEQQERVAAEWTGQLDASERQPEAGHGLVSLDFTEGPHRQHKKLLVEKVTNSIVSARGAAAASSSSSPSSRAGRQDSQGAVEEPVTSARPSSPAAIDDGDGHAQDEPKLEPDPEVEEDKQRKIVRLLEPGDEFQAVYNVSSIRGVDSYPALLLIGRKNLYLVDGYFYTAAGDVVASWEAPDEERDLHLQTLADLAGRNTRSPSSDAHLARRWTWTDLRQVHERRFLFRNCALELFFVDGQGFFITFLGGRQADALADLADHCPHAVASGSLSFSDPSFSGKLGDAFLGQRTKLERMTKQWEQRQISNFEYLMFLNTSSGRSYYDLTCYPVMPWILADYDSHELDLDNPKSFRDLSKPMGCQTEDRKNEFVSRFDQLGELGENGPAPFHFGTHYSSAITVTGYLMRLTPFTEAYLDLQGGSFDHADRLFWSVKRAWESASAQNRSDVRELTPEFFYLPDFLVNVNKLSFGRRQENDEPVEDVALPAWANGDPRRFVELHREALESEFVGTHLHGWIDLVFGFKQRGEAAVEAVNVFSALSYEGAIDLDAVTDADERKAACSTIHSFGQTPRQLFVKPHPVRRPRLKPRATHPLFAPDLAVEQAAPTLVQCILPVLSLASASPIAFIHPPPSSSAPEKVRVEQAHVLAVPHVAGLTLQHGFLDGSLRVFEKGVNVPITLQEGGHTGSIVVASFADNSTLVTGSDDSSIVVWRLEIRVTGSSKSVHLAKLASLRGQHSSAIVSLVASKAYSIIVSGSTSGVAVLWDLNRLKPVRLLDGHGGPVHVVAISETTGDFATCAGSILRIWSVNGVLLASRSMGSATQHITALAWSKSETAPVVAVGLSNGQVVVLKRSQASSTSSGWSLEVVSSFRIDNRLVAAPDPPSSRQSRRSLAPQDGTDAVTALAFSTRALYAGTSSSKTYLFNPPPTEFYLPDSAASSCMASGCGTKFSLVEPRRRCGACAGIFCLLDTTRSVEAGGRFCGDCFSTLSPLLVH